MFWVENLTFFSPRFRGITAILSIFGPVPTFAAKFQKTDCEEKMG